MQFSNLYKAFNNPDGASEAHQAILRDSLGLAQQGPLHKLWSYTDLGNRVGLALSEYRLGPKSLDQQLSEEQEKLFDAEHQLEHWEEQKTIQEETCTVIRALQFCRNNPIMLWALREPDSAPQSLLDYLTTHWGLFACPPKGASFTRNHRGNRVLLLDVETLATNFPTENRGLNDSLPER
jgi:hypothetical protein